MNAPSSESKRPGGRCQPPRSNPPLRSSSGPPSPCITPSTETFVMVVSFMGSSFLSWWFPRHDRTEARISSVERGSVLQVHSASLLWCDRLVYRDVERAGKIDTESSCPGLRPSAGG